MPTLKLISFPICPFVQKAALLLATQGLAYEIDYIDLANKPDWFLAISPLGKVPVLLVDDVPLFESQVILEYLDELTQANLHPADSLQKAQQRALMEFSSSMLMSQYALLMAKEETEMLHHLQVLQQQMIFMETQLLSRDYQAREYFNGKALRMIDLAFAPLLQRLSFLMQGYLPALFQATPALAAWTKQLLALPALSDSAIADLQPRIHAYSAERQSYLANLGQPYSHPI